MHRNFCKTAILQILRVGYRCAWCQYLQPYAQIVSDRQGRRLVWWTGVCRRNGALVMRFLLSLLPVIVRCFHLIAELKGLLQFQHLLDWLLWRSLPCVSTSQLLIRSTAPFQTHLIWEMPLSPWYIVQIVGSFWDDPEDWCQILHVHLACSQCYACLWSHQWCYAYKCHPASIIQTQGCTQYCMCIKAHACAMQISWQG